MELVECPHCQAEYRIHPKDDWARCPFCYAEHVPEDLEVLDG